MKITKVMAASRREMLLQDRETYDAEMNKYKDQIDRAEEEYDNVLWEQQKALEKQISDMIGSTSLELNIKADPYSSFRSKGWSIRIEANQNQRKFSDDSALSWNWEVKLNTQGEVVKDSGSWSGLNAVTPAQMDDLEESVRVLRLLNSTDWNVILHSPMVQYSDFVSKDIQQEYQQRRKIRPDFEKEIQKAELEEAVGTNTAFELTQDQYYRGSVSILLTGLTEKFLKGYIFPTDWVSRYTKQEIIDKSYGERRTSINNLKESSSGYVTHEVRE